MNFNEAIELLEAVSDFHFNPKEKEPDFCLYDNENQGYSLCLKADLINEEYRNHLEKVFESRKLRIRESMDI